LIKLLIFIAYFIIIIFIILSIIYYFKKINKGKLKWGVGKLIAHCPQKPIVIPFCHFGTENTYPQDSLTKIIKNIIPYIGKYNR